MQSLSLKKLLGSTVLLGVFMTAPMVAFAADATSSAGLRINENGFIRVIGAEVTSVSGNIINAISHFKDSIANFVFTTNGTTTVITSDSLTSTTTGVQVGDKIAVTGTLASLGSAFNVAATRIRDITSTGSLHAKSGTVESVSSSTGSFVMRSDGRLITIQTDTSTTLVLGSATSSLDSLVVGSRVVVAGTMNSGGTIIAATKVILRSGNGFMGIMGTTRNEDTNTNGQKNEDHNEDRVTGTTSATTSNSLFRSSTQNENEHATGTEIETEHGVQTETIHGGGGRGR